LEKKLEASTEFLAKTTTEIMALEVSILSKNLEIAVLNRQLKSPPIILPSYKPHDFLSRDLRHDEHTESVENDPILIDSSKNPIKTSSRRSRRVIVDSDSEFEAEEVTPSSVPFNGIKGAETKRLGQRKSSDGDYDSRNRSSKQEIRREVNFSLCGSSTENIDCHPEVRKGTAIEEEIEGDGESSDESMLTVQRPLGKVDIE
jgi:hypothetical protein